MYPDDLLIDCTMPARPKCSKGENPIALCSESLFEDAEITGSGLMGSGFERIISKTNARPTVVKRRRDFRYQGKEYDKDLQWYACPAGAQRRRDFHARQYACPTEAKRRWNPYLGRFLAADPLMQFSIICSFDA